MIFMGYKIIADSCCDLTPELRRELDVVSVPLSLNLGEECFVDDETLDLPEFMEKMKNYSGKIGSACPSPGMYKEAFIEAVTSFAITLSSNLSGSYESAMLGKSLAEETGAKVHVFDSKSASAGELLIAIKLRRMINDGIHNSKIISSIEGFIKEMKTYFVLDNIDNLVKNGRLGKITGKLISVLNIKPIMGSDGDGNIALFSHARGQTQVVDRMSDTIGKSGRSTEGESMVIAHCNNPGLAEKLMNSIKNRYSFKDIFVVPTNGVSSMYANDKGIIMAF